MANKFAKYFSKALVNEAIDDEAQAGLDGDAAALEASIENPADREQLNQEVGAVATGASNINANVQNLRKTADGYAKELNAILDRVVAIHNDITTGSLAQLGIKVGSNVLTGIRSDLSKLAQIIAGGANDAIIKQETEKAKEASKNPVV